MLRLTLFVTLISLLFLHPISAGQASYSLVKRGTLYVCVHFRQMEACMAGNNGCCRVVCSKVDIAANTPMAHFCQDKMGLKPASAPAPTPTPTSAPAPAPTPTPLPPPPPPSPPPAAQAPVAAPVYYSPVIYGQPVQVVPMPVAVSSPTRVS